MSRRIRLYQKKRGHRRTGSRQLGSLGEALFYAFFLLMGVVGLVGLFFAIILPELRVRREFVENTCLVRDKRLAQRDGDNGLLFRPEVQIEYQVAGTAYSAWTYDIRREYIDDRAEAQSRLAPFTVGEQHPCWYDPADPRTAVLVRQRIGWAWLTFIVPVSFIIIGAVGLLYRLLHLGISAERRAALAKRASQLDLFDAARPRYAAVPDVATIVDSPGTVLAYRLPLASSPGWLLITLAAGALVWNAIVAAFAFSAVNSVVDGRPDWWLILSLAPFVAIGLAIFVYFVRQLLISSGIGPTLVEVSAHPLRAGGVYALAVSQSGRLRFNALEVLLVSDEEATYRQGTDTRKESRRVYEKSLVRREGFEVHRGMPLELRLEVEIPAAAMHSFKSPHNEVSWKIIVRGDLRGWPNYERVFPVILYPPDGTAA